MRSSPAEWRRLVPVCVDRPTLLWADTIPPEPGTGILRDELARFREEAGLIAGARSVDEFRPRVEGFVCSWHARNLALMVRKLLVLMVDALEERANDPSSSRDSTVVGGGGAKRKLRGARR